MFPAFPALASVEQTPQSARTRSAAFSPDELPAQTSLTAPENLSETFGVRLVLKSGDEVSRPGESHPEPLSEPYLNVSAHTAPALEPRRTPTCQCAHNFGSRLEIRATQCVALRKCPRSFLYFRQAQRARDRSS
jgi:hypothetical protein